MNLEEKRLKTFYLKKTFTFVEKAILSSKGFYVAGNQLKCYKCEASYEIGRNSIEETNSHHCPTPLINLPPSVNIPSPYTETGGATNVQNDLNYDEFRFATFAKWCMSSLINMSVQQLVEAGFYYANEPQTLKCFYCKTTVQATVRPNQTINEHKANKKCQQKKLALRIRVNNLSRDRPIPAKQSHVVATTNTEPEAGPSRMCTTCKSPVIDSPMINPIVQRAFDQFLSDPETAALYTKVLNLGFDRQLVNTVVKRRLQYEGTFTNVEELIEFCLAFKANQQLARRISQEIEREVNCKICMNEKVNAIFKPCHHVVACMDCGQSVTSCPVCWRNIDECNKIYF